MNIIKSLALASVLIFCTFSSVANDENTGTGIVAETMTAGGYVYVRLEEDDTWVAASPVQIVVGDKIKYSGGMTMKDFVSRTLDRTFDYILFVGKLEVINEFNADVHAKAAASNHQDIEKSVAAVAPIAGEIAPLEGGKTIAAINTEYAQLKDQPVSLRAKVMKVSLEVLGKNWITLQDGTGTAPGNKLLATTLETVEIGDVVTVKGVIRNDIDLGSGYKYKVVLEEATFSK